MLLSYETMSVIKMLILILLRSFPQLLHNTLVYITISPAACQQHLSVHLDRGLAAKLPPREVGVVRGVDVVVRERLVHVHEEVQSVQEDWGVLV